MSNDKSSRLRGSNAPSAPTPAGGAPGRTTRTQHLAPSPAGPSATEPDAAAGSLLTADARPERPPDTSLSDDPFGLHLAAAERGPEGRHLTDALQREALEKDLEWMIAHAEWSRLRPAAHEHAGRRAHARAQARRDGAEPELSGIASTIAADRFVATIKELQHRWTTLSVEERSAGLLRSVNEALAVARVPPVLGIDLIDGKLHPASFDFRQWRIWLRAELVGAAVLADPEAQGLAETLGHETRHAEQYFVVARRLSTQGLTKEQVARKMSDLHLPTVEAAFALGRLENPAESALAARLEPQFTADVELTNVLDRTGYEEMKVARAAAVAALDGLRAQPPTATLEQARQARDDLRERIDDVLYHYAIYRQFPREADAEDAAEGVALAFEALP